MAGKVFLASGNAFSNVAVGERALDNNSSGQENVAIGRHALTTNETGSQNTAIGHGANVGFDNLSNATAIGAGATVDTSDALILGNNANVGIGVSSPGHNNGAARYLTISSGEGNPSTISGTSLELIGGANATSGLQNRIDFIARNTTGTNYTTGRIEMSNSSSTTARGDMRFFTGGFGNIDQRLLIEHNGKITFGNGSNSYSLPTSRGSDGQVLSISHSTPGELEWTNPTSSPWDVNGSNISRSSGYVGIGTSSPTEPLHIKRVANAEAKIESSSGLARLMLDGSVNKAAIDFYDNGTWGGTMGYSVTSDYLFWTESGHGTIMVGKSGNIGIGNTSPSAKLEVTGNTKLDGDVTVGNLSGTGERNVIVDASGKLVVAATNKVAFLTGLSTGTNQTFSGSSSFTVKLPNGSSSFNDGAGYDPNSGYFTAPADGTYQINVSLQVYIPSPQYSGLLQLVLRHGGGKFGEAVESVASSDGSSTYINISMSQTIKLSSGQSIWLEMFSSQDDGNIENWSSSFSGHLVH